MNTKNNQRFRETEIRMESATLELMKRMKFDKITIKKICETAGVNRSTFYAHFLDIYDMLNKMEVHLSHELLINYPDSEVIMFSSKSFIPFLQHIKKHQYFYRISLQSRRDFPLRQGYEQLWNQVIKPHCQKSGIISEDDMMYYFVYYQAGITNVLKRWVNNGCTESEEKLAQILTDCVPDVWKPSSDNP